MNINEVFTGGDFLKATDIGTAEPTCTIASVEEQKYDTGGNKLKIAFHGKQKVFICNKTNARRIAMLYGDKTEGWIGKNITLYVDPYVEFQGKIGPALRVKPPRHTNGQQAQAAVKQQVVTDRGGYALSEIRQPQPTDDLPSDEIPF